MSDTNNVDTMGGYGVKKSNFTQNLSNIPDSATVDYVYNGQNIKTTVANLLGVQAYGIATLHGNSTETAISVASTPVLAAGVWIAGDSSQFSITTGGKLTYTGTKTRGLDISVSFSIERAGSGNNEYRVYIAKNGSVISNAYIPTTPTGSHDAMGALSWFAPCVVANDYFEIFVSNETDTDNVLLKDIIFKASS